MRVEPNESKEQRAKEIIALLRSSEGCTTFNELINEIRDETSQGSYTLGQIGITEIELITLGLNNARLKCLKRSPNILGDQAIATRYSRELVMLRSASSEHSHKAV